MSYATVAECRAWIGRPGTPPTPDDVLAAVLASAALIHTPGFAAPEAGRRFIEDRRADFEANAKNLLYVALTRARDRLVVEWPGFVKERDEDAPEAKCLFHVFADACAPQVGSGKLRIGGVDCPLHVGPAGFDTDFAQASDARVAHDLIFLVGQRQCRGAVAPSRLDRPRRASLHDGHAPRDLASLKRGGRRSLARLLTERSTSVNTAAAGGNASLMTLRMRAAHPTM